MVGVSRYTVAEYLRRAAAVGIGIIWPLPAGLDDAALKRKLFSPLFEAEPSRPQPDWLHGELHQRECQKLSAPRRALVCWVAKPSVQHCRLDLSYTMGAAG